MEFEELLELLELESPEEFEYFENFADLVESEEQISLDGMYMLFSQTNPETVAELLENYFEEMMEAMPDDSAEIYTLLENIKLALVGLLKVSKEDGAILHFAEELYRFKNWYSQESEVECTSMDTGDEKILTLRDAVALSRVEKLGGEDYRYDFTPCLDYELEEYIMGFADLAAARDLDIDDEEVTDEDLLENGYFYDEE